MILINVRFIFLRTPSSDNIKYSIFSISRIFIISRDDITKILTKVRFICS
jgi:hypothetical protein